MLCCTKLLSHGWTKGSNLLRLQRLGRKLQKNLVRGSGKLASTSMQTMKWRAYARNFLGGSKNYERCKAEGFASEATTWTLYILKSFELWQVYIKYTEAR